MNKSPRKKTTNRPHQSAAILLLSTIADTTWRLFVPTIGGTILGVLLDNMFNTPPLFTSVLIAVGFATSILLVTLQIRSVRRSS